MHFETIYEAGKKLRRGDVTATALTEQMLELIGALNGKLNAFITVTAELALHQARQADEDLRSGKTRGPLHGIPVAVKDVFATRDIQTTCGSKLFENWIPDHDATVVARLRDAGAVLLGKTGLDELAYGTTSINPCFGAVANPWAPDHDPGGSSGSSASAVAAAQHFRRGFIARLERPMAECDVLAAPTATIAAAPIAKRPEDYGRLAWKNTRIFNFTGQPSVSIPCGFTQAGLPVGLMLTGPLYADEKVLQLAHAFERANEWRDKTPNL
jgi:Asp-tRNA(Asn)/Glu-tRNA(Gln) amidotransferase A subunit family amidase